MKIKYLLEYMEGEKKKKNENFCLKEEKKKTKHKCAKFSISKSVVFVFLCYNDGKVENTLS